MQAGRAEIAVQPRSILVVEDDHDDYDLLERVCAKLGLANPLARVVVGSDALDFLSRRNGHQQHFGEPLPALILLDLKLPGVDGRTILTQIKRHPEFRRIPVVITSTSKNQSDVRACYEAGANAFLHKAVQYDEYAADLAACLGFWLTVAELPD